MTTPPPAPSEEPPERVPLAQTFFDDLFLLLALDLLMPLLTYLAWGLIEIGSVPQAP